jgi:hypothetical protein
VVPEATNENAEGDDLVARHDPHRLERQQQRVGAGAGPHPEARAAEGGQLPLEGLGLGAEDEAAGVQHAGGGIHQLGPQGRVLALEVDLGDRHQKPPARAEVPT